MKTIPRNILEEDIVNVINLIDLRSSKMEAVVKCYTTFGNCDNFMVNARRIFLIPISKLSL